jgi:hypothetical protein
MLTRLFLTAFVGLCLASASASAAGMMVIHHKVADFAKWRPAFDGDKTHQEAAGLTNPHVYQAVDNPNDVTITFDMADAAKAKAFGTSKELKTVMSKAGVKGKPEVLFLNPAS